MGETPREIELKLAFDPAQARALRDRGIRRLGAEPGGATHLAATYFDTGSQALRKRGLSLRVRREGNRHIQTLKAEDGAGAGLFDRAEWEWEVAGSSPDLDRLADTPFAKLVHGQRLRDEL
ncbi:MAG: CYTH domain-containing protein, partial [Methylobacteriaceae bacterium]|nr:CYTH domain-containing protein [Methylobacteriaceae bacterium]